MDPARLLRFRRAHLRAGDAPLLRPRAALGQRGSRSALVIAWLRSFADPLLAVLLAPSCLACEKPLDQPLSGPICTNCWTSVLPLPDPVCVPCGEPLSAWRAVDFVTLRCSRCRRRPLRLARCRAAGAYDGTLRAAIHGLKYEGRRSVAGPLSDLMLAHAGDVLESADAVVPVPLHAARHRQRGFNQALDLARGLNRPLAPVLTRRRATRPQADLPAGRRHANVRDAFAATATIARWRGATLVLVDDVTTTGATLEACARVLLDAGAREVRAITAARAVRTRP